MYEVVLAHWHELRQADQTSPPAVHGLPFPTAVTSVPSFLVRVISNGVSRFHATWQYRAGGYGGGKEEGERRGELST